MQVLLLVGSLCTCTYMRLCMHVPPVPGQLFGAGTCLHACMHSPHVHTSACMHLRHMHVQVRGKVYELLANCIPPELIMRQLLLELLKRMDDELKVCDMCDVPCVIHV